MWYAFFECPILSKIKIKNQSKKFWNQESAAMGLFVYCCCAEWIIFTYDHGFSSNPKREVTSRRMNRLLQHQVFYKDTRIACRVNTLLFSFRISEGISLYRAWLASPAGYVTRPFYLGRVIQVSEIVYLEPTGSYFFYVTWLIGQGSHWQAEHKSARHHEWITPWFHWSRWWYQFTEQLVPLTQQPGKADHRSATSHFAEIPLARIADAGQLLEVKICCWLQWGAASGQAASGVSIYLGCDPLTFSHGDDADRVGPGAHLPS